MKTVLGLSVTSHGIAWALVDGRCADATPLDDDAFDVDSADQLTARAAAAARSAQAIAASSGQDVAAIGVSAVGPVSDDHLAQLLDLLAAAGFHDVRLVPDSSDTTDADDPGTDTQLRAARSAALAVATNAVVRAPRPVAVRPPAPRRYAAARALAATAAAVATGLLTVGSQYVEPVPVAATDDADISAAAEPQLITVTTPREAARSVALPDEQSAAERAARAPITEPAEPLVSTLSAEAAQPAMAVQPVAAAEITAPQAIPVAHGAVPVVAQMPVDPRPLQQPAPIAVPVSAVPVQHIPATVTGPIVGPPAVEAHLATDPAPGPAAVPLPAPAPAPAPAGLWFLGAMP
ncbi:hypothetical protein [Mycobacterium sp. DL99]|uniref:hypothetical protein n=1 Tax=Mycobacterium sp. DL99 TaxID=2528957 RepID=UPI001080A257|nr:hypothetical protein [Mycobacterium sp. DL99]